LEPFTTVSENYESSSETESYHSGDKENAREDDQLSQCGLGHDQSDPQLEKG